MFPPVVFRRQAGVLLKGLGEVVGGGEPAEPGDLGDCEVGIFQQVFAVEDTAFEQVVNGRYSKCFGENVYQIVFIHMEDFGQPIQRDFLNIMSI